jgi:bacterial/archaeal transporter family protein
MPLASIGDTSKVHAVATFRLVERCVPSSEEYDATMRSIASTWWFYALLAAVFAALTTIFGKVGVEKVNSNLATAIRTIVILALAWAIVFGTRAQAGLPAISTRSLVFLILSGIATGLSWLCYYRALQLGLASQVAPVDKSSLVMTIILAAMFLGEPLTWQVILGGALITVGTFVLIR